MQAVREQYTDERFTTEQYSVMQPLPVQFRHDAQIDINYPQQIGGWLLAKKYPGRPVYIST